MAGTKYNAAQNRWDIEPAALRSTILKRENCHIKLQSSRFIYSGGLEAFLCRLDVFHVSACVLSDLLQLPGLHGHAFEGWEG